MRATGALFATAMLGAVGCGDDSVCHLTECGNSCIDTSEDVNNCGGCGLQCNSDETCSDSKCVVETGQCQAPEQACGSACIDTTQDHDNCGDCGSACSAFGSCIDSACDEPLLAIHTGKDGPEGSVIGRDVFVYTDAVGLTQINTPTGFTGDRVIQQKTLPDGRVLYVGDEVVEGASELYVANPDGSGTPVRLSNDDNRSVLAGVVVSKDGSTVLYRAEDLTTAEIDLFAVNLAAPGAAVQVNGALAAGGTNAVSRAFAVSADGKRAAYITDEDTAFHRELYTVDLSAATPGDPVKVNPVSAGTVSDFVMTDDGARFVYRADQDTAGVPQLYVTDLATAGTSAAIANTAQPGYHAIQGYQLDATGDNLFYTGGDVSFQESLWSVSLADRTNLDSTLIVPSTGGVGMVRPDFVLVPNGVVFRVIDPDFGVMCLFSVALDQLDVRVRLSDPSVGPVSDFALSKGLSQILFRVGGDGPEGGDTSAGADFDVITNVGTEPKLFVLSQATGAAQAVVADDSANSGIQPGYTALDDGRIAFVADLDVFAQNELYFGDGVNAPVNVPVDVTDGTDPAAATDVADIARF